MTNHVALIDHGVGNLRSVEKALEAVGANVVLTRDAHTIISAEKIVLPGVGAFGDCMQGMRSSGTLELVARLARERPFLGICVGMQMLFESSDEMGFHSGLGLLQGDVTRFTADDIRIHTLAGISWTLQGNILCYMAFLLVVMRILTIVIAAG